MSDYIVTVLVVVCYCRFRQAMTQLSGVVQVHGGQSILHGYSSARSFLNKHVVLYSIVIIHLRIPYFQTILKQTIPDHHFPLITLTTVLSSSQQLASIWNVSSTLLSSRQRQLLWSHHFSGQVCSSTLLLHWVILLHLGPIPLSKMFRYVLGRLDRMESGCEAIQGHGVLNASHLIFKMYIAISSIFLWRFREFICGRLSFPCMELVVSFVKRLTWWAYWCYMVFPNGSNVPCLLGTIFSFPSLSLLTFEDHSSATLNGLIPTENCLL